MLWRVPTEMFGGFGSKTAIVLDAPQLKATSRLQNVESEGSDHDDG
jgi:hypothetical protein